MLFRLTVFFGAAVTLSAATTLSKPVIHPPSLRTGTGSSVLITCHLESSATSRTSDVRVAQVNEAGQLISIVGLMRDDGKGEDAFADDGVFTFRYTPQNVAANIQLQCSSIDGQGREMRSEVTTLAVRQAQDQAVFRQLAQELSTGVTVEAKAKTIQAIFDTFSLAVYNSDPSAVQPVKAGSREDVFFFDFETSVLAQALTDGRRITIRQAVNLLSDGLKLPGGRTILATDFLQALVQANKDYQQNPSDTGLVIPAMVRELGLISNPPYDLLQDPPEDQVTLDPLQITLILSDIMLGVGNPLLSDSASVNVSATRGDSQGLTGVQPSTSSDLVDLCNRIRDSGLGERPNRNIAKWVIKFIDGAAIKLIRGPWSTVIIEFNHSWLLQNAISVDPISSIDGHWSHGVPVTVPFSVVVRMKQKLNPVVEACSWLFGVSFPKPNADGQIPGVPVEFVDGLLFGNVPIEAEGTLECVNGCVTDAQGVATANLNLFSEPIPGVGEELHDSGYVVANPKVFKENGNDIIGTLDDAFRTAGGNILWRIGRHQPVVGKWAGSLKIKDGGRRFDYSETPTDSAKQFNTVWQEVKSDLQFNITENIYNDTLGAAFALDVRGTFRWENVGDQKEVGKFCTLRITQTEIWTANVAEKAFGSIEHDFRFSNSYILTITPVVFLISGERVTREVDCQGRVTEYKKPAGIGGYAVTLQPITGYLTKDNYLTGSDVGWTPWSNVLTERKIGWSFAFGRYPGPVPEPEGHPPFPEDPPK